MAAYFLQVNFRCLLFLIVGPLLLAACISPQPYPPSIALPPPAEVPQIRGPKIGQEWVYQVRNVFNQSVVDIVTEKVVEVGKQIRITRSGANAGPLPDEIQSPWGYVLLDPHWNPPQVFQRALPLWPVKFSPDWSSFYRTRYQVIGQPDSSYYWGLNIAAVQWEQITVPAGTFRALKYQNESPYFESNDVFRIANYRQEDLWVVPEIGRWAIRRGYGRYLFAGMFWSNAYWEDYLEWELISWK